MASASDDDLNYYEGSRKFLWLSEYTGLSIDQVNFCVSQVVALIMAVVLRKGLHPNDVSATTRNLFTGLVGVTLVYFCHGRHMIHVIASPVLCYLVMVYLPPKYFHKVVLVLAMLYLSYVHLMRQIYSYGSYVLDITGPMMLITQKMTSLAFCLHDGMAREESALNENRRKHSVKKLPSLIEYFSYVYAFQDLMSGPLVFYGDYKDFINGNNYLQATKLDPSFHTKSDMKPDKEDVDFCDTKKRLRDPSPLVPVVRKLALALFFGYVLKTASYIFPWTMLVDENFHESSFLKKLQIVTLVSAVARFKYYFAWTLADAISNASGLGFNGYDKHGSPKWDLMTNIDLRKVEASLGWRDMLEGWNKQTMAWLRHVVYDRAPFQKTLLTYILSAMWHGFYPGYYVTFLTGALFTLAARSVRRSVRPYFKTTTSRSIIYDIVTFVSARIALNYCAVPFILLELGVSFTFFRDIYFFVHIGALFALLILPKILPPPRQQHHQQRHGRTRSELSDSDSYNSNTSTSKSVWSSSSSGSEDSSKRALESGTTSVPNDSYSALDNSRVVS